MVGVVMNKELIKIRFNKCLQTYNDNAVVQKIMADEIVKLADFDSLNSVLELGCGTGVLTKKIVKKIKFNNYDAIDIVEGCSVYIKEISDKINFMATDIEKYKPEKKYDLIISNAALQWLSNPQNFIENIVKFLDKNGCFIFTVFGEENYKELDGFIDKKMDYFSLKNLKNLCEKYEKFSIKDDKKILKFNDPKEVLYHMKNTGVNALSPKTWTKKDLDNFVKNYPKISDKFTLTYHPIYVKICV